MTLMIPEPSTQHRTAARVPAEVQDRPDCGEVHWAMKFAAERPLPQGVDSTGVEAPRNSPRRPSTMHGPSAHQD